MLGFAQRKVWRVLPLVAASVAVGVGTYLVGFSAIADMQRSHAEYAATSFGDYLNSQVIDLAGLIEARRSPRVAANAIAAVTPIGTITGFRVFDLNGALPADSGMLSRGAILDGGDFAPNPVAASTLATSRSQYRLLEGDGVETPRYYSEVSVPLVVDGRVIGVLSVVSDETTSWPALFEKLQSVLLQVVALIAVAFGLPLLLYLQKTGQLARTALRLHETAQYDELTGCLNRATFTRIMQDLVAGANERGLSVAVHFIDLDRFNAVNESHGHAVGDELLKAAAERLRKLMGTRERIARLGADEFAICQPYYVNSPLVTGELANDVVKAMSRPFEIGGDRLQLGASVGYAHYPRDGATVPELMRAADIAIHKAKQNRRGKAVAFDPSMESERQRRQSIESRMREALVENDFDIHFQPLFETATGRLRGFESLLRLAAHDGVPISPAEFIPIAEEVGLIDDIGRHVLRESCRMAGQWPDHLVVSVNLSPAQFTGSSMTARVREVLDWSGLPPHRLELEITESVLITDTENVLEELRAIKALGVSVALDDFGTGYSSLSYLWRFPFDKLKVDKSFMTDLAVEGSKSREVLSTIIALGRVLDLKVTAEGVETEQQAKVLRELRCDLVQGYLYGRPMRAVDVAATVLRDMKRLPELQPPHVPGMHELAERGAARVTRPVATSSRSSSSPERTTAAPPRRKR